MQHTTHIQQMQYDTKLPQIQKKCSAWRKTLQTFEVLLMFLIVCVCVCVSPRPVSDPVSQGDKRPKPTNKVLAMHSNNRRIHPESPELLFFMKEEDT